MKQYYGKELLKLVSEGDENAFKQLFDLHKNTIYSIAFTFTKSVELSHEVVQDVFLKVWLRRTTLNSIENLSAYLFTITRNHIYKVLKQIAQNYTTTLHLVEDDLFVTEDVADLLVQKENSMLLQKAIGRLPNQQQKVYRLMKDQGLKRDEVAYQLNLQPETVKFHLAQAMKNIRTYCMHYFTTYILLFFSFA